MRVAGGEAGEESGKSKVKVVRVAKSKVRRLEGRRKWPKVETEWSR